MLIIPCYGYIDDLDRISFEETPGYCWGKDKHEFYSDKEHCKVKTLHFINFKQSIKLKLC